MKPLLAMFTLVLVAGCGGGTGSGSSHGSDAGVLTAQSVADRLGCTDVKVDSAADRVALAEDTADCKLGADTIHIATFTSNEVRDNFAKVATGTGGVRIQVGEREAVYGDDATTADALKGKLGGSIRTS